MVAVITEGKVGKRYRPVEEADLDAFERARQIHAERPQEMILPEINAEGRRRIELYRNPSPLYGMKTWGSLFNQRQLVAMQTFVAFLHEASEAMEREILDEEYRKAIGTYLGLWISRKAMDVFRVGPMERWRRKARDTL